MSTVTTLGYFGLNVTKVAAWDELFREIFALELRSDGTESGYRYRLDGRHHRISLYPAESDEIRYVGWEARTAEELESIAGRLRETGVDVQRGTESQIEDRCVTDLIAFEGPDGVSLEVFWGAQDDMKSFVPSRQMSGFNTGDLGMGHVVLHCSDLEASAQWYQDMLGFRVSDGASFADPASTDLGQAKFLRCNPRHHSLALVNECFGAKGGQLNHFMLEGKNLADVGRAYDLAQAQSHPLAMTFGMHVGDETTSFYLWAPSPGVMVELGSGGLTVDDEDWSPTSYDSISIWGHDARPPPAE